MIPSYTIDVKETEKIDKLFTVFDESGVFGLIDDHFIHDESAGGRPSCNRYNLMVLIAYGYAFRHMSLRDLEAFCKFDLRAIYIMENEIPSHATIGNFYKEFIVVYQEEIFSRITEGMRREFQIEFDEVFIDGSKFEADANKYNFVWKPTKYHEKLSEKVRNILKRYNMMRNIPLEGIIKSADIASKITEFSRIVESVDKADKGNRSLFKDYEELKKDLIKSLDYEEKERICGPDRNSYYKTDHDATAMCLKRDYYSGLGTNTHAAYNTQIIVSRGIIATYLVSQSRTDIKDFIPSLERFHAFYDEYPTSVCADSGYGSLENYEYLASNDIENYVKYFTWEGNINGRHPSQYVLLDDNTIRCLNGNIGIQTELEKRHPKKANAVFFRVEGCNSCLFKDYCKRFMKNKDEDFKIFEVVLKLQEYIRQSEINLLSTKGIEMRINRSTQVEGAFGIIKEDMPFDRFTRTSLPKVSAEFMMICLGYNIRKLFRFYDGNLKFNYWVAPEDLEPEQKKKPSAKRLSNKIKKRAKT